MNLGCHSSMVELAVLLAHQLAQNAYTESASPFKPRLVAWPSGSRQLQRVLVRICRLSSVLHYCCYGGSLELEMDGTRCTRCDDLDFFCTVNTTYPDRLHAHAFSNAPFTKCRTISIWVFRFRRSYRDITTFAHRKRANTLLGEYCHRTCPES